ncbi:c-type cytochrome [Cupriavidus metallidurans]|uniref:SorB family sulfite dehydrogenase c-type cytochrome subunit n=1 Tax=Cupriavidus metallidurans TaxID=119219 RepID=UPI001CCA8AFB|nr:c-type cytochrome [Cupriavidus metallidurans]UBM08225.1 c-type cytochrome [Cupriavidus metallidurans]
MQKTPWTPCSRFPARRLAISLALMLSALPAAHALEIQLPPETASYQPSELPGYRLVQQNCMTCHSAQYVSTQPQSLGRAYWDATVKKMKTAFGAPLRDEDIPVMADYLVRTYGAERQTTAAAAVSPAPAASAKPAPAKAHDASSLLAANNCLACHAVDKKVVGPAFHDVAAKYAGQADAVSTVMRSIRAGGSGKWGSVPMPPFADVSDADLRELAGWVLGR